MSQHKKIYINELARIVNRRSGTIRKWEAEGRLPKSLMPKRDKNKWRYWSNSQVFGSRGIIAWMRDNDMRPGRLMTEVGKETEHVHNLRKPKYLNGHQIRGVKIMVDNGRSRDYIVRKLYPRTRYTSESKLEAALVKLFKENDWTFPAKFVNGKAKLSKSESNEVKRLERQIDSMVRSK